MIVSNTTPISNLLHIDKISLLTELFHSELTGREKIYLNSSIMGQLFAQLRKREKRNIIDVRRPKKEKLSLRGRETSK